MSFVTLLQDSVRVWRPTETIPQTGLGVPVVTWAVTVPATARNSAIQRRAGVVRDVGAGDAPEGQWKVYMLVSADVRERDVLEVVAGTQPAGKYFLVDEVYPPRGHHQQLTCRLYLGDPPA